MKLLTKATKVDSTYSYNETSGKYMRMYQCPAGTEASMIVLYISNLSTGNASISIGVKRGAVVIPFLKDKVVSAKDFLHIHGGYVVLQENDEVIAYAASNSFSVICTFEEVAKVSMTASGSEPTAVTV